MSDQSKSLGLSIADVNRAIRSPAGALTALRKTMSDRVAIAVQSASVGPVVDWSIAPHGATHRFFECLLSGGFLLGPWYKFDLDKDSAHCYSLNSGGWEPTAPARSRDMTAFIARPVEVEEVWSYTDDFKVQFTSLAALLADYADVDHPPSVGGSDTVYRGEWVTPDPAKYVIGVEGVTEHMYCQAADEIEDLDDYPQVSEEGAAELEALLKAWARKHAQPDFRIVANITPHVLSEVY